MGKVFDSLSAAQSLPERGPLHLAIGMFDGVHLGHQAVIEAAVRSARRSGGMAAVLTFDPHPSRFFRPADPVRLIMDREQRVAALLSLGVGAVIVQPFNADFAGIEAEALLLFLRERLRSLHTVYVGENWRFGRGRRGDITLLVTEAKKLGLHVVSAPRINGDGEPISSTRIRALLTEGRIDAANVLLGHAYASTGVVQPGKQLGRTLGFPTLNLPWTPDLSPRLGVYVVKVARAAGDVAVGTALAGVANYGLRPTVEQTHRPQLEVHVLDNCPFTTGDALRVEWLAFLRPEQKFSDVNALRAQIEADRRAAQVWFTAAQA
ncbi:MAG: riboflavin biosynthesis protein RibF [Verrucomicrobia bacterium]|nr:riboflavin biosynthesis protein RibF [Verrucomicrobiota bacterium]